VSRTHLVTFSDESMSESRRLCVQSAKRNGVDDTSSWDPVSAGMLDNGSATFKSLMAQPRGAGLWVWKPAIIRHDLQILRDGDICIYADAGIEFINNISHIIDRMDQDIFLFGNNWEHAHWCKRDIVDEVWPYDIERDGPFVMPDISAPDEWWAKWYSGQAWLRFGKQCQASVIFFRVSDYTRQFVAEWLKWCLFEGGRLIDDSPSRAPNHPEFRENRHDQAILTTMAYREGIKLHYWPAVYNRGSSPEFVYEKLPEYAGDDYPILFNHHRKRNHEWGRIA
jgi:hypothetical protein